MVADVVSDASPRELAALRAALREGEQPRWATRSLRRRRLYVLTNHRALILERGWWAWRVTAYPLHEQMLHSRLCRPGGSGDLLFAAGSSCGFTRLPNLQEAHRELNAAIHALADAAEMQLGNRAQNC